MDLRSQCEKLREITRKRIAAADFTGAEMARKCGISHAHFSNILAGKRLFTMNVFFAFCNYLGITSADLEPKQAKRRPPSIVEFIPVVSRLNAITKVEITPAMIIRNTNVPVPSLAPEITQVGDDRWSWTRFVAVTLSPGQIQFMEPFLSDDSIIVIDRHDQKVHFSTVERKILYALSSQMLMSIGYIGQSHGQILLMPPQYNRSNAEVITLPPTRDATHNIVGRIYEIRHRPKIPLEKKAK